MVSEPSGSYCSDLFFVPSAKRFSAFGAKKCVGLYMVNDQKPFYRWKLSLWILETQDGVIRVADDHHLALRPSLAPGVHPEVETVVQIYVRKEG